MYDPTLKVQRVLIEVSISLSSEDLPLEGDILREWIQEDVHMGNFEVVKDVTEPYNHNGEYKPLV